VTNTPAGLAEQLRALRPGLRRSLSAVVPVSQVLLHLKGASKKELFDKARDTVLKWTVGRAGRELPEQAWAGEAFELEEVGAQRVVAAVLDHPRYWATRVDDADKSLPQRTWVTEVGIGEHPEEGVLLGARLTCVTQGRDEYFIRSMPGFVKKVARPGAAWVDGYPVRPHPWLIESEKDVEALIDMLHAPRRCDVIVLALPDGSTDPRETVVSAKILHDSTIGAAHVAVLTGPASFALTDRLGKPYSVFRRAVRTYRPGFDISRDEPFSHPLALPHRIEGWPDGGPEAYVRFLVDQSLARTVSRGDALEAVPSFAKVRELATKRRLAAARQAGTSDKELLVLADQEIVELRGQLDEQERTFSELLRTAEGERDRTVQDNEALKSRLAALRYRVEQLEEQSRARGDSAEIEAPPTSLDDFEDWCDRHLGGAVEVHARAYQAVKKSEYENVALIYQTLLLLRDLYVPMRRHGGMERKSAFEDACRELGLDEQPTFSGNHWGEEGETYRVRRGGRSRLLERHLKNGGNTRDPRRCFRLYFYWDDEDEQVVVGWLPSHLDSRAT